jgi:hypothetical protein
VFCRRSCQGLCRASGSRGQPGLAIRGSHLAGFDVTRQHVGSQVKSDLETPDLWAELQREVTLLGARSVELIENTPFTPDEQNEIARRLQRLAGHARNTYSLSPEQIRLLDEKLNYLVEASARLGRIDWLNAFVGAILGYILTAAFPPVSAGHVFDTFIRAIIDLYPLLPSG